MSVQTEKRAAAPNSSSSTMPPIAVTFLVGVITVALALSISMGSTAEPQAADYPGFVAPVIKPVRAKVRPCVKRRTPGISILPLVIMRP